MRHMDSQLLLKIVVIVATAVVVIYFGSLGYLDFTSTTSGIATTPEELMAAGNYDRAIKSYRTQIANLETLTTNAQLGLAQSYERNEQPAEAEATYRKVVTSDPTEKDAYVGLSRLLIEQGRYDDATTLLTAGLAELPDDIDLLKLKDDLANRDASE
ncbi:tetratricopeptide repeat protein [Candidatus Berkelbacteria bacterium]|nr:tetratricopeptide repeat protein [Candidatus Berkelbacteria bacterium]